MELPKIISCGVYRKKETYRQRVGGLWIGLYISGIRKHYTYFPDGVLLAAHDTDPGAMLTLGMSGFIVDFEFGAGRENWVLMLDSPDVRYCPERHQIVFVEEGREIVLPFRIPLDVSALSDVRLLFQEIEHNFREGTPKSILNAKILSTSLFSRFLSGGEKSGDPAEYFKLLIDKDLQWKHSLAELSDTCGFSRDHLRLLFFERYRIYPNEYRTECRIQRILHEITYTDYSIKEIAFRAGMRNVTHLYALLKKHCSETPSSLCRKYRNRVLKHESEITLSEEATNAHSALEEVPSQD